MRSKVDAFFIPCIAVKYGLIASEQQPFVRHAICRSFELRSRDEMRLCDAAKEHLESAFGYCKVVRSSRAKADTRIGVLLAFKHIQVETNNIAICF